VSKANYAASCIAHMIEMLCKKSWELKLISVSGEPLPESQQDVTNRCIILSPRTMLQIFQIIQVLHSETDPLLLSVRASLLNAVRVVSRNGEVLDIIRKKFIQLILEWCKDGKHIQFNRIAWRTFFELIEYHGGMLERMEQTNTLCFFTDIIGATIYGNAVLLNCIHYITKIFSLAKIEQQRIQSGRPPKRTDGHPVRDDVKFFVNYFRERALFIKFHMIYIRFHRNLSGAIFIELARFYNILSTNPDCAKLLSSIQKNKDYQEGLNKVMEMYSAGGEQ